MERFRVATFVGMLIFLTAMLLPWVTLAPAQGAETRFRLVDLFAEILAVPDRQGGLANMTLAAFTLLASSVLYPVAAVLGIAGTRYRSAAGTGGVLGVLGGILWVLSLETLKTQVFTEGAGASVFFQVNAGYGVYVAMAGGVVMLSSLFLETPESSSEVSFEDGVRGRIPEPEEVEERDEYRPGEGESAPLEESVEGDEEILEVLQRRLAEGQISDKEYFRLKRKHEGR